MTFPLPICTLNPLLLLSNSFEVDRIAQVTKSLFFFLKEESYIAQAASVQPSSVANFNKVAVNDAGLFAITQNEFCTKTIK
jgi:hypothetical protein